MTIGSKTLAVQPVDDVNGDALGAAGAQHRNDMDYSDSTHDIGLKVAAFTRGMPEPYFG